MREIKKVVQRIRNHPDFKQYKLPLEVFGVMVLMVITYLAISIFLS